MTSSHPTPGPCQCFSWLAAALDRRSAPRLVLLFCGADLARGTAQSVESRLVDEDFCEVEGESPGRFEHPIEPGWGVVMAREK